ncbi:MAG: hypothetical protein LLF98_02185 [Clostridium sp.]|uniref:hypothetical protein n=1 Tax=Clostridium sp. TaxID=1506 RepID=UPI0025B96EEB|nr:hypothetical protein [Clostridium sp.]MCE5220091.1 hypothetical protein [Clostridium sp.]
MKLTVNNYFDNQDGSHIATKFYIDGNECGFDEYAEMLDSLNNFQDECDEEINDENYCKCEEERDEDINEQCDCPICTLERYVDELVDITGGCPGCIRECLIEFMNEIVNHIVVESEEKHNLSLQDLDNELNKYEKAIDYKLNTLDCAPNITININTENLSKEGLNNLLKSINEQIKSMGAKYQ